MVDFEDSDKQDQTVCMGFNIKVTEDQFKCLVIEHVKVVFVLGLGSCIRKCLDRDKQCLCMNLLTMVVTAHQTEERDVIIRPSLPARILLSCGLAEYTRRNGAIYGSIQKAISKRDTWVLLPKTTLKLQDLYHRRTVDCLVMSLHM